MLISSFGSWLEDQFTLCSFEHLQVHLWITIYLLISSKKKVIAHWSLSAGELVLCKRNSLVPKWCGLEPILVSINTSRSSVDQQKPIQCRSTNAQVYQLHCNEDDVNSVILLYQDVALSWCRKLVLKRATSYLTSLAVRQRAGFATGSVQDGLSLLSKDDVMTMQKSCLKSLRLNWKVA